MACDEIGYVDHIKMWVPIIFELRKSRVYDNIIAKDWGVDAHGLVDLSEYEKRFPLLISEDGGDWGEGGRSSKRRPSMSRNMMGRRPSSRNIRMSRSGTKEASELNAAAE